jgi:hypothetical protein
MTEWIPFTKPFFAGSEASYVAEACSPVGVVSDGTFTGRATQL